jgi:uncharacterized Zn ribbon protein
MTTIILHKYEITFIVKIKIKTSKNKLKTRTIFKTICFKPEYEQMETSIEPMKMRLETCPLLVK